MSKQSMPCNAYLGKGKSQFHGQEHRTLPGRFPSLSPAELKHSSSGGRETNPSSLECWRKPTAATGRKQTKTTTSDLLLREELRITDGEGARDLRRPHPEHQGLQSLLTVMLNTLCAC